MMPPATTWARETARLSYFAVAMQERQDDTFLGLFEQANHALEAYLNARQAVPPDLYGGGRALVPAPDSPATLPGSAGSAGSAASPVSPRRPPSALMGPAPAPQGNRPPPLAPRALIRSLSRRQAPSELVPPERARHFRQGYAEIQGQLTGRRRSYLAALDAVCAGKTVDQAAFEFLVDAAALLGQVEQLNRAGARTYLQAATQALPE